MSHKHPGLLISGEGIDGSGKTSALVICSQLLKSHGLNVIDTREPGGTLLGERLREILLSEQMDIETEALLMFASRRELVAKIIEPALRRGDCVVSDRFTDSSYAFQSGGRGLSLHKMRQLEEWVLPGLQPDLTLLFDVPTDVAHGRISKERALDRFEKEAVDFHARTRSEYLRRAAEFPDRFRIIDATQSISQVNAAVTVAVKNFLSARGL